MAAESSPADSAGGRGGVTVPALFMAQAAVAASFLFWLCTSPLIRYGCVWVYLTAAVVFGGIYDLAMHCAADDGQTTAGFRAQDGRGVAGVQNDRVQNRGWRLAAGRAMSVAAALLLLYKGFALAREIVGSYVNDYWIVQKEYENYETYAYEIEGVTFYCPVEGDQTGYDSFPSSPAEADIVFLGDGIEDGFRAAE